MPKRILLAYQDIIRAIWSAYKPAYVRPMGFITEIRKAVKGTVYEMFGIPMPNDSHEFLIYLLDNFHEAIKTTLPKAKELRSFAEPLITLSKEDNVAKRRLAFARLRDREVVTKLFNELGPRYKNRAGGYLRIMKCGFKTGDNAPMAYVELVDRPEASAE